MSATSFNLPAGASQTVNLTVLKVPTAGSLYGNLDVVGTPMGKPKRNGIVVAYRLISTVRLEPAKKTYGLQMAAPTVSGKPKTRVLSALVRNAGNSVDPVNGTATVSGPGGPKMFAISGIRILPGGIVNVKLGSLVGRKKGSYTVAVTLTQGSPAATVVKTTKKFKIKS